jgi:lipid II:glycine glycyltransferase (peptidoglycan interpeptide bridge formation enzyme)
MSHRYQLCTVPVKQQHQWDTFVSCSPCGHLLQSWGWGELKASAGWHPLRIALWDSERQQIAAVAQILRRTATQIPLQFGHLAYIPKGPVLDCSNLADEPGIVPTFFSQLHLYLRKRGALALQVELAHEVGTQKSNELAQCLDTMHFQPVQATQPLRTIMLDLTLAEDTLLANMKEKWRYNIRLAGRKGVRVRIAETVEDVRNWYGLLQTTSIRDSFGIHTLNYYLRAWQIFAPRNQAQLFLADYNGKLLAGIFVGLMAKQAIYLYGASSNEHRQLMPNHLLQWEAIRWAKHEGATTYDFWGIPESDDQGEAMAGVYRFKSGWGGRVVRFLGNYEYVYHPLAMHLVRKIALRSRSDL